MIRFISAALLIALSVNAETLTLEQIEARALQQNYTVRTAVEKLNKAKALEYKALGQFFPEIVGKGDYTKIDKDRIEQFNGMTFGEDRSWSAGVELRQSIFSGGRASSNYRKESIMRTAAELELQAVKNQVLYLARSRYYDLLLAERKTEVEKELVKLREEFLKLEEKRFEVGLVPKFNVLRAKVELANRKTPQIKAENDQRIALEELRRTLGLETKDTTDQIGVVGELSFEPTVVAEEDLVGLALKSRPELQRLEILIDANKNSVAVERSDFFPQIDAYAGYGVRQSQFDRERENKGWEAGLRGEWKIFDSFRTINAVDAAQSDLEAAKIAKNEFQEGLTIDVRRAYSRFREALELVEASSAVVEEAKEGLRLAEERLKLGAGIQLDVLEQQASLTEAKTNEASSLHAFRTALSELKYVTGSEEVCKKS